MITQFSHTLAALVAILTLSLAPAGCDDPETGNQLTCESGTCTSTCDNAGTAEACNVSCLAGTSCDATCNAGQSCQFSCAAGATCDFKCAAGTCVVEGVDDGCACSGNCTGTCGATKGDCSACDPAAADYTQCLAACSQ